MSYQYIDYLKKYYKIIILVLLVFFFFVMQVFSKESEAIIQPIKVETEVKKVADEKYIYVDIKGLVESPGVYKMKDSERVIDLVIKAGGLIEGAVTTKVNLSQKLIDEMVVNIPGEEETLLCEDEEKSSLISLNKASLEELMTLPGIGESKARAIIDYRIKYTFSAIEEIMNVTGIGQSTFNNIKDYITV